MRHAQLKRSSGTKNFFKILAGFITAVIIAGVGVGAYAFHLLNTQLNEQSVELITPEEPKVPDAIEMTTADSFEGKFSMVIVGSDSRKGQQVDDGELSELADVIMLVNINEEHTRLDVVSFPRDLMVSIPACVDANGNTLPAESSRQINSSLSGGGLSCVVSTISELTGEEISYAALVNFDSVMSLTEKVGGVDVCIASDIYNYETGNKMFGAGTLNLQGTDALAFLRERKGIGDGSDIGRISNQQIFMKSFLNKVLTDGTLYNPVKVYSLAKITIENLTLSSNLASIPTLASLATLITEVPGENIQFHTAPNMQHPYDSNRLMLDEAALNALIASFLITPVSEAPVEAVPEDSTSVESVPASDSNDVGQGSIHGSSSEAVGSQQANEEARSEGLSVTCAQGG